MSRLESLEGHLAHAGDLLLLGGTAWAQISRIQDDGKVHFESLMDKPAKKGWVQQAHVQQVFRFHHPPKMTQPPRLIHPDLTGTYYLKTISHDAHCIGMSEALEQARTMLRHAKFELRTKASCARAVPESYVWRVTISNYSDQEDLGLSFEDDLVAASHCADLLGGALPCSQDKFQLECRGDLVTPQAHRLNIAMEMTYPSKADFVAQKKPYMWARIELRLRDETKTTASGTDLTGQDASLFLVGLLVQRGAAT